MIYGNTVSEISEKDCVKKVSDSKAKIRFVQHCAYISVTAELSSCAYCTQTAALYNSLAKQFH